MNNRQFDSNNKSIDSFFKKIGLGAAVRPDQFWKNIDKKYGKLAREFGDCVELREKGEVADPYPLKNQSIEFANAIATQFDISKIKSFLLKFINIGFELEGSRVLEIGCDNGILLCYLALTYPNTSFIGIDPCTQAIELANHRAKSLNLNNVTFKSVSIDTFANISKDEKLDLIISIAVFHEILGTNEFNILKELTDNFSIEGVDNHFKEFCIEIDDLKQIFTLLNEDGIFLSADRWGHPTTLLRWIRLNEKIGLNCLLPHCDMLEYTVPMAGTQIMPLTFFNKSKVRPLLACDILSLKAFPDFVKQKHLHLIDDPLIAEMIYGSFIKEES
jgi:SAM-dependent methyltransferase